MRLPVAGRFLGRLFSLKQYGQDARDLWALLLSRGRGRYRGPALKSMLALALGITYIAVPADLIPDWMLVLGQLDDYAVVAALLELAAGEIAAYRSRTAAMGSPPSAPSSR